MGKKLEIKVPEVVTESKVYKSAQKMKDDLYMALTYKGKHVQKRGNIVAKARNNVVNALTYKGKHEQKRYYSMPGVMQWMREKAHNPFNIERAKNVLVGAGATAMVGLSVLGTVKAGTEVATNISRDMNVRPEVGVEQVVYSGNDFKTIQDKLGIQIETEKGEDEGKSVVREKQKREVVKPHSRVRTQKQGISDSVRVLEDDQESRTITLQDALMATLDIGFDTEFKIAEGNYHETPEGTGHSGGYKNKTGMFKASYVSAGTYGENAEEIGAESGKSFYQIKKEKGNLNAYLIKSANETGEYGWNPTGENNIEMCMVQSELDRIKPYLSEEAVRFLEQSDLSEAIDVTANIRILAQIKQAQMRANEKQKPQSETLLKIDRPEIREI